MDDFPAVVDNSHIIKDLISHIEFVNHQIKELENSKQISNHRLKELMNHPEMDGSKKYDFDKYKVTITTGLNHTLNKKKYEQIKEQINPKFDPVREVIKHELNKKVLRDCVEYGSQEDLYNLSLFVSSTPKKLHISIEVKDEHKPISDRIADDVDGDGV